MMYIQSHSDIKRKSPLLDFLSFLKSYVLFSYRLVETIIQVVCGANGRLFPATEGLSPHATAPLFAFLFGKLPCKHDFCGGDNNSGRLLRKRPSFSCSERLPPHATAPHATAPLFAFLFGKLPCKHDSCQIKKQPESSFQVACGGDNKTRTYDLYDVNVAL